MRIAQFIGVKEREFQTNFPSVDRFRWIPLTLPYWGRFLTALLEPARIFYLKFERVPYKLGHHNTAFISYSITSRLCLCFRWGLPGLRWSAWWQLPADWGGSPLRAPAQRRRRQGRRESHIRRILHHTHVCTLTHYFFIIRGFLLTHLFRGIR